MTTNPTQDLVTGFVLAGGHSSRMGTDKAFLPYGDSNLLHHALETLSAASGRPAKVVVSPHKLDVYAKLFPDGAVISDVERDRGALGGIHAALTACETEFALILAVDLPLVTPDCLRRLVGVSMRTPSVDAVVPEQDDGRLQPLCGIYRAATAGTLKRLLLHHDRSSVRDLLARINTVTTTRPELSDDPSVFFNVNDRESYESLRHP
jgi:molybdopterin-guanine dinucleotide biosynthesis protein A